MFAREIVGFDGVVLSVGMVVHPMNRTEYREKNSAPERNNIYGGSLPVRPARSASQDRAGHCGLILFDHLDFPIFSEEGDVFTFIYIVEG